MKIIDKEVLIQLKPNEIDLITNMMAKMLKQGKPDGYIETVGWRFEFRIREKSITEIMSPIPEYLEDDN